MGSSRTKADIDNEIARLKGFIETNKAALKYNHNPTCSNHNKLRIKDLQEQIKKLQAEKKKLK